MRGVTLIGCALVGLTWTAACGKVSSRTDAGVDALDGGSSSDTGPGDSGLDAGGTGDAPTSTDAACSAQSPASCTGPNDQMVCLSGKWTSVTCPASTPACIGGTGCVKCTEHSQCPGSACHLSGPKQGTCFDLKNVVTAGTAANMVTAISAMPASGELAILVQGSLISDQQVTVGSGQEVAIIGHSGMSWSGNVAGDPRYDMIQVGTGGILYLSGIRLESTTATCTGVGAISGSIIWVDDCFISGYVTALSSGADETHVRRSFLRGASTAPLYIATGALFMHTSVLAPLSTGDPASGLGAIMFGPSSSIVVDIRYSTIIGGQHAIACNDAPAQSGSIRNSILLDHTPSDGPLPAACNTLNVAGNYAPNTFYSAAWFVDAAKGDFHLSTAGAAAVSQTAKWGVGDPTVDIDGTARPSTGYPGIDQP